MAERLMKDSGYPWIGCVPNTWGVRKIKNYYSMQTGFTPDTKNPEYYDDENIPTHENSTLDKVEGNVARYRFMKNDITAAALIAELSNKKKMKDVAIEEVGIDEIIRIAYGQ